MRLFVHMDFSEDYSCRPCLYGGGFRIPAICLQTIVKAAIRVLINSKRLKNTFTTSFSNKYCHLAKSKGLAF